MTSERPLWNRGTTVNRLNADHPTAQQNGVASARFETRTRGVNKPHLQIVSKEGHVVRFVFPNRMSAQPAEHVEAATIAWETSAEQLSGQRQREILQTAQAMFQPMAAQTHPKHYASVTKAIENFAPASRKVARKRA